MTPDTIHDVEVRWPYQRTLAENIASLRKLSAAVRSQALTSNRIDPERVPELNEARENLKVAAQLVQKQLLEDAQ